jgi:hypothetical protein
MLLLPCVRVKHILTRKKKEEGRPRESASLGGGGRSHLSAWDLCRPADLLISEDLIIIFIFKAAGQKGKSPLQL